MDDLALSIDRQNAENLIRPSGLTTSGCQQPHESRQHTLPSLQRSDTSLSPASATSEHVPNVISLVVESLENILKKSIPDDSAMALSFKNRESRVIFMSPTGYLDRLQKLDLDEMDRIRSYAPYFEGHGTLVIEDVNLKCYQKLCAKYSGVIDPARFAEHIVSFDDLPISHGDVHAIKELQLTHHPGATVNVNSSGNFMTINVRGQVRPGEYSHRWKHGFHLDIRLEATHGEAQKHSRKLFGVDNYSGYRTDVFERDALSYWRRISIRIIFFQLEVGFYLMLVDGPPDLGQTIEKLSGGTLCLDHGPGTGPRIPRVPVESHYLGRSIYVADVLRLVASLSEDHKLESIFDPRITPTAYWEDFNPHNRLNKHLFTCLLAETGWRRVVLRLESQLQKLRQEVTITSGAQAFKALTEVRRQLAEAQSLLADTERWFDIYYREMVMMYYVDGKALTADQFWRAKRNATLTVDPNQQRSLSIRDIPDLLKEYEERLRTMSKTVNEEIQLIIGSVQVEDAKVMRRQTEWTVVLAVLAAIYLPMTLVTGIFGMNITEIGDDKTAPDRWSVVKACGLVFGATIGGILVYIILRNLGSYWRVGRMLFKRKIRRIRDGRLYRKLFAFNQRLKRLWLYRKFQGFRRQLKEWDVEAQKLEKMK